MILAGKRIVKIFLSDRSLKLTDQNRVILRIHFDCEAYCEGYPHQGHAARHSL